MHYVDNTAGQHVVFNGMTAIFPVTATVIPGETYHIKLVIGDAIDTSFDSGLFFGASSFRSLPDLSVATPEHSASNPFSSWMDATGQVHVSAPGSTITSLRVFDMQGRSIFQERYSGSDRISSKPITSTTGAYVIEVEMDGEIKRDRLIKQ